MNETILTQEKYVRSVDVNKHRFLRTSRLFDWFQQIAFDHVNILGLGSEHTTDKGLLWVLAAQNVEITRMPRYDETVTLRTWPGPTRMSFFPRSYEIIDSEDNIIVRSASMWALIDESTRQVINPDDHGLKCESTTTGTELKMKGGPKPLEITKVDQFEVPFSYIDLNGHMNNARYLDLVDDNISASDSGLEPHFINARYGTETTQGTILSISQGNEDNSYYLSFDSEDGTTDKPINHFRLRIDY